MNKNHAKPLLAGVLALSLAGALTGCGPKAGGPGEAQKKGTAVETQTVSAGEIATKNQLSGKVVPRDEVSIFAPQEADVLSLNVSVGDTVSSGMVLFTLDSASVQRQITQVEGERGRTASLYDEQISQARETLSTTKTLTDEQLRQAEQSRDNTKKLHELGAASDIELEKAEASYVETKLNAQSSVQSAELSISRLETEKANQLSNYDKTLADLREQLDDLSVKATVSGTVTAVNITRGGKASPQAAAVTIATSDVPQISLSVSETIQPWLHTGDTVTVQISALGGDEIEATVASVAPSVNAQTNLYDVLLDLPADVEAAYGMFATVTIYTDARDGVIVIPTESILNEGTTQYVFIVSGESTAARVDIETGLVGDGVTQVTNGLETGDELVPSGQSYLSDGVAVRVVKRDGEDMLVSAEPEAEDGEAAPSDSNPGDPTAEKGNKA